MGSLGKHLLTGLALLLIGFHTFRQLWKAEDHATFWKTYPQTKAHNISNGIALEATSTRVTRKIDSFRPTTPFAFVSFLTMDDETPDLTNPAVYGQMPNFISARILTYQFVHAPETRSQKGYPFIIAVGPEVPQPAREQLQRDGAEVIEVEQLGADWLEPGDKRFRNVMTKLRVVSWTRFKLVCLFDLDTTLTQSMDGIFEDPVLKMRENRHLEAETEERDENDAVAQDGEFVRKDEGSQPETYMLAGMATVGCGHGFPPEEGDKYRGHWINAGLLVWRPSTELYEHYLAVLSQPQRFDSSWPEEGLLNYVHRSEGNMPWADLDYIWNAPCSGENDLRAGVRSLHRKWWDESEDGAIDYARGMRRQMEKFYDKRYRDEERRDVKYRFRHQ